MAFMKSLLDEGSPTGHSDVNSSDDEEHHHARLSLPTDDLDIKPPTVALSSKPRRSYRSKPPTSDRSSPRSNRSSPESNKPSPRVNKSPRTRSKSADSDDLKMDPPNTEMVVPISNRSSPRSDRSSPESNKSSPRSNKSPRTRSKSPGSDDLNTRTPNKVVNQRRCMARGKASKSDSDSSGLSDSESETYDDDFDTGSLELSAKKPPGKAKPAGGTRHQPLTHAEPLSHEDMLEEKFQELRKLLTDNGKRQVDKHLLKKAKIMMKYYQVTQSGLLPSPALKGPWTGRPASGKPGRPASGRPVVGRRPASGKLPNGPAVGRSSRRWSEQPDEYLNRTDDEGEDYILIDGTGDVVKTRRVKFTNMRTESIDDNDPAYQTLGSLGIPVPLPPGRPSRPTTAGHAFRPKARQRVQSKENMTKGKSKPAKASRSSSRSDSDAETDKKMTKSRSKSHTPRSRSTSSERSESGKRSASKSKKTDHHLKDTENKTLQEWLTKKNKELKIKKKEERRAKKAKRELKQKEFDDKMKQKEKSEEAVRIWMIKKEEEQRLLKKRERVDRSLTKNECSYSLELLNIIKGDTAEDKDHHVSNPELSRGRSGAPFVRSDVNRSPTRARVKSAKPREYPNKEGEKKRTKYNEWLKDKNKQKEGKQRLDEEFDKEVNEMAEGNRDAIKGEDVESNKKTQDEDQELLTDVGMKRDVNMNIRRRDSDSFDPYNTAKDYSLDPDTRRNLYDFSSTKGSEPSSPSKLEGSHPSFRMPSPPLHSDSPVPMRDDGKARADDIHRVLSPPLSRRDDNVGDNGRLQIDGEADDNAEDDTQIDNKSDDGNQSYKSNDNTEDDNQRDNKLDDENQRDDGQRESSERQFVPSPPLSASKPDVPRSSAYRRIKREQASWDEFSDSVWKQVQDTGHHTETADSELNDQANPDANIDGKHTVDDGDGGDVDTDAVEKPIDDTDNDGVGDDTNHTNTDDKQTENDGGGDGEDDNNVNTVTDGEGNNTYKDTDTDDVLKQSGNNQDTQETVGETDFIESCDIAGHEASENKDAKETEDKDPSVTEAKEARETEAKKKATQEAREEGREWLDSIIKQKQQDRQGFDSTTFLTGVDF